MCDTIYHLFATLGGTTALHLLNNCLVPCDYVLQRLYDVSVVLRVTVPRFVQLCDLFLEFLPEMALKVT
mgnify:CR=1 FL=1